MAGGRPAEAVRRARVVRGAGKQLQALPALWERMEACEERETAAQLLHKALTGVPGRNKKVRLQMFKAFKGITSEEMAEGQRLEVVRLPATLPAWLRIVPCMCPTHACDALS